MNSEDELDFSDLDNECPQIPLDLPFHQENLARTLSTIVKAYPNEVITALLERSWWPKHLETLTTYATSRYEDDSHTGMLCVTMSPDSDAWIEVVSVPDRDELKLSMRFRTYFGGGQSHRVRNALLILAEAMRRDNEERPQHRGESGSPQ